MRTPRLALAALAALAAGFSPFQAEEPNVREGNERLLSGDAEGALRRFAEAEKALGPRPEIAYDRGNAQYRRGDLAAARDAWREALSREPGPIASRAFQNLGNALEGLGDREGAVAALREALVRDPSNADARYNLEVLLRKKDEDAKRRKDDPKQGAGGGEREEPSQGPAGRSQEQPSPAKRDEQESRGERVDPRQAQAPPRPDEPAGTAEQEGRDGGARPRPEISRQDAERLLDALRARERKAPAWTERKGEARRRDAEKDW